MLSPYERKEKLGHGAVRQIAQTVGCSEPTVSNVLHDNAASSPLSLKVQNEIARRLRRSRRFVFGKHNAATRVALLTAARGDA